MRSLIILALSASAMVSAIPVAVPSDDVEPAPIPTEPSVSEFPFSGPTGIGSFGFSLPSNLPFGPGANGPSGTDGHFPSFPTGFPSSPQFPSEGSLPASESSPFAIPSGLFASGGFPSFPGAPSGAFASGFPTSFPTGVPSGFPSSFPTGLPSGFQNSFPAGFPSDIPNSVPTGLPTGFPGSFSFGGGIPGFPSFSLPAQGLPTSASVVESVPTDASESVPVPTPTLSL